MNQFFTVGDWLHDFVALRELVWFVVQHAEVTVFLPDGILGDLVPSLTQGGGRTTGILYAMVLEYRKNSCDSPSEDSCKTESLAQDRFSLAG